MMTFILNLKQLINDKQSRFQVGIAFLVLITGFSLSILGFLELEKVAKERLYLKTQSNIESKVKKLQYEVDKSLGSLEVVSTFYQQDNAAEQQLIQYMTSDASQLSGVIALGWVPKLSDHEMDEFEEKRKKTSSFYLYEMTGHGVPIPAKRGSNGVYPIQIMVSPKNARSHSGFNLASVSSKQKVMEKAVRTQKVTIGQRASIFFNGKRFYGFQAFYPVFDYEQLGRTLKGFVIGNYDIEGLIESVFTPEEITIDTVVYAADKSHGRLLYSSSAKFNSVEHIIRQQQQHWVYPLVIADKEWLMVFLPNQALFAKTPSWFPYFGLIGGGLLTVLLVIYLLTSLIRARQVVKLSTDLEGTSTALDIQTKLKHEADRASSAKSGLLRAASHDLRQPLHTISLLTTLLKDSENEQEKKKLIEKMLMAIDGMNTMFGSLLDISLLESNELMTKPQHFYLQDIFDKIQLDFELQAKQKGVELNIVETSLSVFTDPVLLERIIMNLVSNAIRYTETGKILCGCRRKGPVIRIQVMDTGLGLDEEAQQHIFETFYRDEAGKKISDKGLGLGLAIVKETAKFLNLNLGVISTVGKGSNFYLDVMSGNPLLIGESETVTGRQDVNKVIWVIEDDRDIRVSMEQLLRSWQCDVYSAASSDDVKLLLKNNCTMPEIIIADYQLVNETGVRVAQKIKQHFQQEIKTIILTGTTERTIQNIIQQQGFNMMIKPVKPESLNIELKRL